MQETKKSLKEIFQQTIKRQIALRDIISYFEGKYHINGVIGVVIEQAKAAEKQCNNLIKIIDGISEDKALHQNIEKSFDNIKKNPKRLGIQFNINNYKSLENFIEIMTSSITAKEIYLNDKYEEIKQKKIIKYGEQNIDESNKTLNDAVLEYLNNKKIESDINSISNKYKLDSLNLELMSFHHNFLEYNTNIQKKFNTNSNDIINKMQNLANDGESRSILLLYVIEQLKINIDNELRKNPKISIDDNFIEKVFHKMKDKMIEDTDIVKKCIDNNTKIPEGIKRTVFDCNSKMIDQGNNFKSALSLESYLISELKLIKQAQKGLENFSEYELPYLKQTKPTFLEQEQITHHMKSPNSQIKTFPPHIIAGIRSH